MGFQNRVAVTLYRRNNVTAMRFYPLIALSGYQNVTATRFELNEPSSYKTFAIFAQLGSS